MKSPPPPSLKLPPFARAEYDTMIQASPCAIIRYGMGEVGAEEEEGESESFLKKYRRLRVSLVYVSGSEC